MVWVVIGGFLVGLGVGFSLFGCVGGGLGSLELNFWMNWCIRVVFRFRFACWWFLSCLGLVVFVSGLVSINSSFGFLSSTSLPFLPFILLFSSPGFISTIRSVDLLLTRLSGNEYRPIWAPE